MNKSRVTKCAIFFTLLTMSCGQFTRNVLLDSDNLVDPQTLVEKWELAESRMKGMVKNAIKMLLPLGVETSQSLNISGTCVRDTLKVVSGLKRMKLWAFKFLDASSKSLDGVLDGTVASLGNYDECVGNEVIDERSANHKKEVLFRGKYCRVEVKLYLPPKPKKIYNSQTLPALENFTNKDTITGYMARMAHVSYFGGITLGVCVPSSCSKDDVNQVLKKVTDYIGLVIRSPHCEIKEDNKFTPLTISIISLYSFTVLLVIISTITDVYRIYYGKKFKGTNIRVLMSFSLVSNFKKLIDTSTSSETFGCLNSIKTISMTWIIHGHSLLSFTYTLHKMTKLFDIAEDLAFQSILSATIAVDTFFFLTGTLVCYNVTTLVRIGKKPFNVIMYVFHRIWRIYPTYIYIIAFFFLIPLLTSGPEYHSNVDHALRSCEKNWWASLLFINNFYDPENMCFVFGWYLTVDLQLHIAALFILLPLMRKPKLGITLAVITIVACMIGSWLSVYLNDLMPKSVFSTDLELANNTFRYFYSLPHAHAGPYCVGILCGYLLAVKPQLKITKVIQILGWSVATITSVSLLYGVPKWNGFIEPTFIETLFFSSCCRTAWSLCVAWVVVCCSTGHGGFVNYVLTWKMWIPIGRITFVVYLVHPIIIIWHTASLRTEVLLDFRNDVWRYFGHLVMGYICAFGVNMLVESPFSSLEKILLFGEKRNQQFASNFQRNVKISHSDVHSIDIGNPKKQSVKAKKTAIFNTSNIVSRM